MFENKTKATVWRERKELAKDLLTALFSPFSSLALIVLEIPYKSRSELKHCKTNADREDTVHTFCFKRKQKYFI